MGDAFNVQGENNIALLCNVTICLKLEDYHQRNTNPVLVIVTTWIYILLTILTIMISKVNAQTAEFLLKDTFLDLQKKLGSENAIRCLLPLRARENKHRN